MNWIEIKSENDLPEEGKYVLARHNRGTWHDSTDQENVNCVVVKLVRGISMKDRELMKQGKIKSEKIELVRFNGSVDKPIYSQSERYDIYSAEDEHGNNLVPYIWKGFGINSFNGQEITHWMPIEPISNQ